MNDSQPSQTVPDLLIEPMRKADLAEVLGIEVASFSLPWTEEMFDTELSQGALAAVSIASQSRFA